MTTSVHLCTVLPVNDSAKRQRVSVLLNDDEFQRFDEFCEKHGFKKSTLIARLIREFLEGEKQGENAK